jgi:hypothetical protein
VVLQFKALIKGGGGGTGSESVLSANMSKHPYKKFKGHMQKLRQDRA